MPGLGDVNAGEMIRARLEENHQLDWTFSSTEDDAVSEVEAGRAYAAIVIPADFSDRLAELIADGGAQRPAFEYFVNEKVSPIAP